MGRALAPECLLLDPSRDQASSTNQISMLVSDDGKPSLSATQAFGVRVGDYLEIGLGSAVMRVAESGAVPLPLYASAASRDPHFTLKIQPGDLRDLVLSDLSAAIEAVAVQSVDTETWLFSFTNGPAVRHRVAGRSLSALNS